MGQSIARIYGSHEAANAAVTELHERGFRADLIQAASPPDAPVAEPAEPGHPDDTVAPAEPAPHAIDAEMDAMVHAGLDREQARIYAERLQQGEVLVVVIDPLFGRATTAIEILDSHHPVHVDLPMTGVTHAPREWDWHSPTPLSSWMGWPVLLANPTPLSDRANLPVLKAEPASSRTLDTIRKQSDDPAPLSSKMGLKLLSEDPAPLSTAVKLPLLTDRAAPLSDKAKLRVQWDSPAPLSTKLGWRLLLNSPTPLSSALGLKVLLRHR